MKETVSKTNEAIASVVNSTTAGMSSACQGQLQEESQIKRLLHRHRAKHLPSAPKTLADLVLEGEWTQTTKGEPFLLCDEMIEGERLIIFCSEQSLRKLASVDTWYGDGTFSIAPRHFFQLYTLHTEVLKKVLPMAFCFLTRKTQSVYYNLFMYIRYTCHQRNYDLQVSKFRCDFEKAAMSGISEAIPSVISIEACFFHFKQAHWRKVQELGLRTRYNVK